MRIRYRINGALDVSLTKALCFDSVYILSGSESFYLLIYMYKLFIFRRGVTIILRQQNATECCKSSILPACWILPQIATYLSISSSYATRLLKSGLLQLATDFSSTTCNRLFMRTTDPNVDLL